MPTQPHVVPVSDLDGKPRGRFIIRRDLKNPGRIYCQAPPQCSLSPAEAVAIANRLADVLEGDDH